MTQQINTSLEEPPILGETPGLVQGSKWLRKLKLWIEDSKNLLNQLPGLDRYFRSELLKRVLKSGDTMTGNLTMSSSDVTISGITGDIITTENVGESIEELDSYTKDLNDQFQNDRLITKDHTGFVEGCVITGNNSNRKVTLSTTVEAYFKGDRCTWAVNGWQSPAHGTDTSKIYFLYSTDGTEPTSWSETLWKFEYLQIASAWYNSDQSSWVYSRECHGFMPHDCHENDHYNVGAWRQSGGDVGGYTLNSTTAADRRPTVSEMVHHDEDLETTQAALAAGTYTQAYLTSTGIVTFNAGESDIVPLSTARPYYNSFSSPNWGQTLMPSNSVMSIWLVSMPMCSDSNSQALRFVWEQGQWITQATGSGAPQRATAVANEKLRNYGEMNLGNLRSFAPEMLPVARVIIVYTSSNWYIADVLILSGSSFQLSQGSSGNFLTSVSTDTTLTGEGTVSSPLGIASPVGISYGGTGETAAQEAIDALTQVSGATNEHVLTKDTATGNAIWKAAASGSSDFSHQTTPPISSTDTGTKNSISYDANYFYLCTATNTWKRISWGTALTLEPDTW